jgi:hypothetical protein
VLGAQRGDWRIGSRQVLELVQVRILLFVPTSADRRVSIQGKRRRELSGEQDLRIERDRGALVVSNRSLEQMQCLVQGHQHVVGDPLGACGHHASRGGIVVADECLIGHNTIRAIAVRHETEGMDVR